MCATYLEIDNKVTATGEYENAKGIYQTAYTYERFNGKYIKDVVVSLCESGKKEEGERFLNIHKDEITKDDELGKPKKW